MKKVICLFVLLFCIKTNAQLFYNKGQKFLIQDSALIYVMGSCQNDSSALLQNQGQLYLDSSFINYNTSMAEKSGRYYVKGDWVNSAIFIADSSKVYLWGLQQFIKGTSETSFWDLLCSGTGPKQLNINTAVTDSLVFSNLEIRLGNDTLFFNNPHAAALSFDSTFAAEGFFSNDSLGALSRTISGSDWYIYPMGTSLGGQRYRPLVVKNGNTNLIASNRVAVSYNDYNATFSSYITNLKDSLCKVDSVFYHEIKPLDANNASYDLRYYFYKPNDHNWNTIGNWLFSTSDWRELDNSIPIAGNNGYYNYIQKDSFLLSRYRPVALADKYPKISSFSGKDSVCKNQPINVSISVNPVSDYQVYWSSNGLHSFVNNDSTHESASIQYNSPGIYQVQFHLIDTAFGCGALQDTSMVIIRNGPVAGFSVTTSPLYAGLPVNIEDQSTGAVSWNYLLGNTEASTLQNPIATYFVIGQYQVTQLVLDKYGCRDSVEHTIQITDGISIPNVFTPNGDGTNELFNIKGIGTTTYSMEITNRWGEMVYKGGEETAAWDGRTIAGLPCPAGTYFYILSIQFSGGKKEYKGFVELYR